jgi:hypothetical protein
MKAKVAALMLGLGAAGLVLATGISARQAAAASSAARLNGPRTGPLQAWEIVAQVTGVSIRPGLPERALRCKPDGSSYTCLSWIDVCKS